MKQLILISLLFIGLNLHGQNTVGALRNDIGSYDGYTLFAPLTSTETYLIDNCGQVVHQWSTSGITDRAPGASVYLLENGNLLRTGRIGNTNFPFGGIGGKIELYDWDNTLLWEYTYSTTEVSQHHDIYPLPNGNILILAVTTITEAEAIQAGRDPNNMDEGKLFNEQIIELNPDLINGGATIVWQWDIKDHLIQDFDITKDNFGVVADNPQLLDINYLNSDKGLANWLHINSMQYNASLDQIILSTRVLSEVYIIDHSTTTAEAALHSGGTYGKGGDILYRWGNPEAYDHGDDSDRTLFGQHYPHWIAEGLTDAGKLIMFNNGGDRLFSSIDIINPSTSSPGVYDYNAMTGYLPTVADWSYTAPVQTDFASAILSSGQRLPNGNTLICDGDSGYFFEIDSNKNIVWEYVNPDSTGGILTQGVTPSFNLVFRALKFAKDYPAFVGKDLSPGNPIEISPDLSNCTVLSSNNSTISEIKIYPNPTKNNLNIVSNRTVDKIEVYNILGGLVITEHNLNKVSLKGLSKGLYIVKIYSGIAITSKKIIKE